MSSGSRSRSPKKSKPFTHDNFLERHEKVDALDKLMLVSIRTLKQAIAEGQNVEGLLDHMEMICVKSSTKIYQVKAFIDFDKAVRDRANAKGISVFSKVDNADVLTYFSYDNTLAALASKQKPKQNVSSKPEGQRVCFNFNKADTECVSQSCRYKHVCMFCRSSSHGANNCRVEGKTGTTSK